MASIKKYNSKTKSWETISTTNAAGISVDSGEVTERGSNSSKVLESLHDDVELLKEEVAWLAKYGGGGSGTGGGGSSSVEATILVNGSPTNSDVALTNKGITITIQSSNDKLRWNITATANSSITVKQVSNSVSMTISESDWKKIVSSKATLNVTAYSATALTTIFWNGTVSISSVTLVANSEYSTAFNNRENYIIPISYTLGSTGYYRLFINDIPYDSGKSYSLLSGAYNVEVASIESVCKIELSAGRNPLVFRLENVDNPEINNSVSVVLMLTAADPIIYCPMLSEDPDKPTENIYYSDPTSISMPFTVYYVGTSFTYKIDYESLVDNSKKSNNSFANNSLYNKELPNATLQISDIVEGKYKITITTKDAGTSETMSQVYYIKMVAPASGLLHNDHDSYYVDQTVGGETIKVLMTDKIFDFNANGAAVDSDNRIWKYNDTYKAYIENINAFSQSITQATHSMRLQNGSYLRIPMTRSALLEGIGTQSFVQGVNFGFTLEISYKSDYHPDDERIVLQWGTSSDLNNTTGLPSRGIMIRDHDLYIGANKVLTLQDDELVNIAITYYTTEYRYDATTNSITGNGTYFVYVDGVIEAASSIANNIVLPGALSNVPIYVGACSIRQNGVEDITYFTDMDLYRLVLYNKALSPYDILMDYLNNCATANYVDGAPNTQIIKDGLRRNFINTDANGNVEQSVLFNHPKNDTVTGNGFNAGKNYDNTKDDLVSEDFNLTQFVINGKLSPELANYTIPIPILYLNIPSWSWEEFIAPATGHSALSATSASIQYYDQKQSDTMHVGDANSFLMSCTVKPQGTSTLADYIKNLNITFDDDTIFCPKREWLPEQTYTLKADIVDSSHSLNASIGKFVNTELGLTEGAAEFYPFSPTVKNTYNTFKKSDPGKNCFPNATLKHGVEGFPVFVIIQFKDNIIKTLGIYQFILGRNAARNLGYQVITKFTDNGNSGGIAVDPVFSEDKTGRYEYPLVLTDVNIATKTNEGVWIEFTKNDTAAWDHQGMTNDKFSNTVFGGPFWQKSSTFYSNSCEVKYSSANGISEDTNVMNILPFEQFVDNIISMPVVFKRYSITGTGVTSVGTTAGAEYMECDFDGKQWTPNGKMHATLGNNDDNITATMNGLPLDCIRKYFVIMMFFGLVDNFQKNMPIKIYKDANGKWETPLLGIYDTDTGCGQNNQAVQSVSESMWYCALKNDGTGFTEAHADSNYSTIVGTANKMWTIDHSRINAKSGNAEGSMWTSAWNAFADLFYNKGISINNLADYFYYNYFLQQTEGCGELLFNLTYISKYISKYSTGENEKTNQLGKLHGRRRYQVRSWLNKRVQFLNSIFYAYGAANETNMAESTSHATVTINAAMGPQAEVMTNAPVILGYSNQGSANAYVFCEKNTYVPIFFGQAEWGFSGSDFSAISHQLTNPNQIIKLGTGNNPLYDIGFGNINSGSLCYLSDFNCSAPTRSPQNHNGLMAMDNDYMGSRFCRTIDSEAGTKRSELRNIDFRRTLPLAGVSQYILNLENGFDKLQTLYINDSCITNLVFPKGVSIRDFNIANSNISTLNVESQNFIKTLDITGCAALQQLTITNCLNLESIVVDSSNSSLTSLIVSGCPNVKTVSITNNDSIRVVSVNAPATETFTINNCKNLETVSVAVTSLKNLNVADCANLTTLNFITATTQDPVTGAPIVIESSCEQLTSFNASNTKLQYAGFNINVNEEVPNIVDLYYFKNLTYVNLLGNNNVEYIQLANNKEKPITLTNSFNGCANIKRIYGTYKITYTSSGNVAGMFRDCKNFSIFGTVVDNITYKGKNIKNTDGSYNMPFYLISGNYNTSVWETYNWETLWQDGKGTTNLLLNNVTNMLTYLFYGTSCTTFDVYYIFNMLAAQRVSATHTISVNMSCSYTFYGTANPVFSWADNNNPNRYMFFGCSNIVSFGESFKTGPVYAYSPTTGNYSSVEGSKLTNPIADDGLFSPLVNLESCSRIFTGAMYFSRHLFRRKSSSDIYTKFKSFTWQTTPVVLSDDKLISTLGITTENATSKILSNYVYCGDFTDFFVNINKIETIHAIFGCTYIDYTTVKLPTSMTSLTGSLNASSGAKGPIIYSNIFPNGCKLTKLTNSFMVSGSSLGGTKTTFYIYEGMFKHTPTLRELGYDPSNSNYGSKSSLAFNGSGLNKIVVSPNLSKLNDTTGWSQLVDSDFTEATRFPFELFNDTKYLRVCAGFFMELTNTTFGNSIPKLPGDVNDENGECMFKNNTELIDVSCLFKNVNFPFELSSNGFANSPNLTTVYHLFYHNARNNTNYSTLRGSIPYKMFYHGSSRIAYTTNVLTEWTPWTAEYYATATANVTILKRVDDSFEDLTGAPVTGTPTQYVVEKNTFTEVFNEETEETETVIITTYTYTNPSTNVTIDVYRDGINPVFYKTRFIENDETYSYHDILSYTYQDTNNFISKTFNTPNEDEFFGTNKTDAKGNGSTGVIENVTVYYDKPNQNIKDMTECFYGCIQLEEFRDIVDPSTAGYNGVMEVNPNFISTEYNPAYKPGDKKYTYKRVGSRWQPISTTDENVIKPGIGYWCYNGDPSSVSEENKRKYIYLESFNIKQCTDGYISWAANTNGQGYVPSVGQPQTLHYLAAPDLLRYCTDDANTTIIGLFDSCGLTNITATEGNNYFAMGLSGRICPYMLKEIPKITSIKRMFRFCRKLTSYLDLSNNTTYFIPVDFFSYAKNVTNLSQAFQGVALQPKTSLDVFGNLSSTAGLDIRGLFSCTLFCPSRTESGWETWNISGLFANKLITFISGAFSQYNLSANDSASTTGYITPAWSQTGYHYVPRAYLSFSNNFTAGKIPSSSATRYVYYNMLGSYGNNCSITEPVIDLTINYNS